MKQFDVKVSFYLKKSEADEKGCCPVMAKLTVSRMMGHTSITTTQIYAHVTDRKVDEDMKRLKEVTAGRKINIYEEGVDVVPMT